MSDRRVAITGIGVVSPIGNTPSVVYTNLLDGISGIGAIPEGRFSPQTSRSHIAGIVAKPVIPETLIGERQQKGLDDVSIYAVASALQAAKSSGADFTAGNSAVIVGTGAGGLSSLEKCIQRGQAGKNAHPLDVVRFIPNMPSSHVARVLGVQGESYSVITACASGSTALGQAYRMVKWGAGPVLAGGVEATVCPVGLASFSGMRALSTHYNGNPEHASRPFDSNRDGFVMAEGAVSFVLEDFDRARSRGADIHAEMVGYAATTLAETAARPGIDGQVAVMKNALRDARLSPEDIAYVHAHGTSTPIGDSIEVASLREVFGSSSVSVSSTKGHTGHMIGASGPMGALAAILALQDGVIPHTLNLEEIDSREEYSCVGVDHVIGSPKEKRVENVLVNAFAFGGQNASLVLSKV